MTDEAPDYIFPLSTFSELRDMCLNTKKASYSTKAEKKIAKTIIHLLEEDTYPTDAENLLADAYIKKNIWKQIMIHVCTLSGNQPKAWMLA